MKRNLRLYLFLIISLIVASFFQINPVIGATSQGIANSGDEFIQVNKLILNETPAFDPNPSFAPNQTIVILLLITNIATEPVFNINFNDTYDSNTFEIVEASNPDSQNLHSLIKSWDELQPGKTVTFQTSIKIIKNESQSSIIILPTNITLEVTEFKIPVFVRSNSLVISLNLDDDTTTTTSILGSPDGDLDSSIVAPLVFLILPIFTVVAISFIFGLRRRKN